MNFDDRHLTWLAQLKPNAKVGHSTKTTKTLHTKLTLKTLIIDVIYKIGLQAVNFPNFFHAGSLVKKSFPVRYLDLPTLRLMYAYTSREAA